MIKRLYKRIRLYFINRHIYKIHNKTLDIKDRINWIREHMFDKDIIQVTKELEYLDTKLRIYNMELNSYKQDKERIEAK